MIQPSMIFISQRFIVSKKGQFFVINLHAKHYSMCLSFKNCLVLDAPFSHDLESVKVLYAWLVRKSVFSTKTFVVKHPGWVHFAAAAQIGCFLFMALL